MGLLFRHVTRGHEAGDTKKSDSLPEKLKAVLVFFSHGNLPEW